MTGVSRHVETTPLLGDDGYLFSQREFGYNRNSTGKARRELREKIGMDEFAPHDLRHLFASGLIAAGRDVVTVQHALGHSSRDHAQHLQHL